MSARVCPECGPNHEADSLRRVHFALTMVADKLEALPVKRRGASERERLVLDVDREIGKVRDTLCVFGHGDPGERSKDVA